MSPRGELVQREGPVWAAPPGSCWQPAPASPDSRSSRAPQGWSSAGCSSVAALSTWSSYLRARSTGYRTDQWQQRKKPLGSWVVPGTLTNLFGDLRDGIAGQVKDDEVLETGDEAWDVLQAGPMQLPLLDLRELHQHWRQGLPGGDERWHGLQALRNKLPTFKSCFIRCIQPGPRRTPRHHGFAPTRVKIWTLWQGAKNVECLGVPQDRIGKHRFRKQQPRQLPINRKLIWHLLFKLQCCFGWYWMSLEPYLPFFFLYP